MLKILWKRGEIAPEEQFLLLPTIFCYLVLDFYIKTRIRFSLRDKRLFEITEDEIARVDCISSFQSSQNNMIYGMYVVSVFFFKYTCMLKRTSFKEIKLYLFWKWLSNRLLMVYSKLGLICTVQGLSN